MIILQTSHVQKSYADKIILEDATITIHDKDKIGLVGANGAGKSTLLKIMVGLLPADQGDVIKASDFVYGYLAQDSGLDSDKCIWDEMLEPFQPLLEMENQLQQMEQHLTHPETILQYDALTEKFRLLGGYTYKANIARVLKGLRFAPEQYQTMIHTLSGGQKTRLALAKQLLSNPQLLILDEPTNYLDTETLIWLEQYLKTYTKAVLVVSHDRFFLDEVTTITYELEHKKTCQYNGNYSRFLVLKEEKIRLQEKMYRKQKSEILRQQEFIDKNMARASTTARAKSREKMLAKMVPVEKPVATKSAHFSFKIHHQSGNEVIQLQDISIGYPNVLLAQHISGTITKGERIALIGPNGIGKTTLLKNIASILIPLKGSIRLGHHVNIGYYQQEQTNQITNNSVLNEVWDQFPSHTEQEIRSLLAGFLLKDDAVFKTMNQLSGGEKARVSLAKLSLLQANLLLLDEPTNHLDIYAREILEKALLQYEGTIVFISHDRYFLQKISTRIWELTPTSILDFPGDYQYYQMKKAQKIQQTLSPQQESKANPMAKNDYQLQKAEKRKQEKQQKQIAFLEQSIEEIENQILHLQQEMEQPSVYQNVELLLEKNQQVEDLQKTLAQSYQEWTQLLESCETKES